MKKYKPIYVSPEVQAKLKAFAAMAHCSMGEMAEEIIMKHIESANSLAETSEKGEK